MPVDSKCLRDPYILVVIGYIFTLVCLPVIEKLILGQETMRFF